MIRTTFSAALACACVLLTGCRGSEQGPSEAAKAPASQADAKAPGPPEDPAEPNRHEGAGGSGLPHPEDRGASSGAKVPPPGGTSAAAGSTAAGGAPGPEAADSTGGPPAAPDPKAMLAKVRSKKTPDETALALLADAEAAGASKRALARAALGRAKALFGDPARAERFLSWAKDKDPKYPEPVFELARQAAIRGDVPTVKTLLSEVKKRGGKRLLDQIDFDPTWDIVKDDPDVRALLR